MATGDGRQLCAALHKWVLEGGSPLAEELVQGDGGASADGKVEALAGAPRPPSQREQGGAQAASARMLRLLVARGVSHTVLYVCYNMRARWMSIARAPPPAA